MVKKIVSGILCACIFFSATSMPLVASAETSESISNVKEPLAEGVLREHSFDNGAYFHGFAENEDWLKKNSSVQIFADYTDKKIINSKNGTKALELTKTADGTDSGSSIALSYSAVQGESSKEPHSADEDITDKKVVVQQQFLVSDKGIVTAKLDDTEVIRLSDDNWEPDRFYTLTLVYDFPMNKYSAYLATGKDIKHVICEGAVLPQTTDNPIFTIEYIPSEKSLRTENSMVLDNTYIAEAMELSIKDVSETVDIAGDVRIEMNSLVDFDKTLSNAIIKKDNGVALGTDVRLDENLRTVCLSSLDLQYFQEYYAECTGIAGMFGGNLTARDTIEFKTYPKAYTDYGTESKREVMQNTAIPQELLTVEYSVNKQVGEVLDYTVVTALYKGDRVVKIEAFDVEFEQNEGFTQKVVTFEFDARDADADNLKVFVWEDLDTCKPYEFIEDTHNKYYVSPKGADSNDGKSPSRPFKTPQTAANKAKPGDTVYFMDGLYENYTRAVLNLNSENFSGRAGEYITYTKYKDENPVFVAGDKAWQCINIQGSFIVIDGLRLKGIKDEVTLKEGWDTYYDVLKGQDDKTHSTDWVKAGRSNTDGIYVNGRNATDAGRTQPNHIIVRNCEVSDFPAGGIVSTDCDYFTVENNKVYNNMHYSLYGSSGISLLGSVDVDDNYTEYEIKK